MSRPLVLALLAMTALAGCSDDPATSTLAVDFPAPHEDVQDAVAVDGEGFTAYAQLMAWADGTGADVQVSSDPNFGHFLQSIDGMPAAGASAYWALAVNGEASNVGMDEVIVGDGDTITWTYTTY